MAKNLPGLPPLTPEFKVRDIGESLRFYLDLLGFSLEFDRPENKFAMVNLGGAWIMLEQTEMLDAVTDKQFIEDREWITGALKYPFGRGINFQIVVNDLDSIYSKLLQNDYPIKVPLEERWYRVKDQSVGVRQFLVMDPDGYLLRLQQDLGVRPA
jgi:catechol 2,3-dioxygenase-like lactoylglutathione lyase family enzyme